MYLVFDTETTGLPKKWNAPLSDLDNWLDVFSLRGNYMIPKEF